MRTLFWKLYRAFIFLFDPETAHRITVSLTEIGIRLGSAPLRIVSGAPRRYSPELQTRVWDLEFRSKVGLAAGFDKNAELLRGLPALGFGFCELGTVTPRPQPGNDRPRLFRDPARSALFNRMGFNNLGATVVADRVRAAKPGLPSNFPVGVNLGKNKDTSVEDAASDYAKATTPFEGLADYLVVNVSSPNTPGLRSLQTVSALKPIVGAVLRVTNAWKRTPPLLVKLAPEIQGEDLAEIVRELEKEGVNGWVLTNTLGGTWPAAPASALTQTDSATLRSKDLAPVVGGWSGAPVAELSLKSLDAVRSVSKLPIISVGGIFSPEDARERIRRGADLVQIYSGWIYKGPVLPRKISEFLA